MNLMFQKFDPCMTPVGIIQAVYKYIQEYIFCAQSQMADFQFLAQPWTLSISSDIEEKCLSAPQALFQDTKLLIQNHPLKKGEKISLISKDTSD